MKTPGSRKWSVRRMRSPSSAPWVNGEDGSIESTATSRSASRRSLVSAPISVDLPTPGRPGEADDRGPARVRVDLADELPALGVVVLDQRDRPRQRALVAVEQALGEVWRSPCGAAIAPGTRSLPWSRARPPIRLRPPPPRGEPPPRHGGPLALLRFMRAHGMLNLNYARLIVRLAWLKLRWRGRLQTDGLCFVGPGVTFEIGRERRRPPRALVVDRARLQDPRARGRGAHRRQDRDRARECTISAFQHVSIGRECIVADRVMLIDFDHGVVEVERPIRLQGIYKRDVSVGHNVWIGYGAVRPARRHRRRQRGDRHQRGRHRTCRPTRSRAACRRGSSGCAFPRTSVPPAARPRHDRPPPPDRTPGGLRAQRARTETPRQAGARHGDAGRAAAGQAAGARRARAGRAARRPPRSDPPARCRISSARRRSQPRVGAVQVALELCAAAVVAPSPPPEVVALAGVAEQRVGPAEVDDPP